MTIGVRRRQRSAAGALRGGRSAPSSRGPRSPFRRLHGPGSATHTGSRARHASSRVLRAPGSGVAAQRPHQQRLPVDEQLTRSRSREKRQSGLTAARRPFAPAARWCAATDARWTLSSKRPPSRPIARCRCRRAPRAVGRQPEKVAGVRCKACHRKAASAEPDRRRRFDRRLNGPLSLAARSARARRGRVADRANTTRLTAAIAIAARRPKTPPATRRPCRYRSFRRTSGRAVPKGR
jgi:hypothetical protein